MLTAHFQNLSDTLCHYLSSAQRHIQIAVCWFSHRDIFDLLVTRIRAGVTVELLIEYDSQNIRDGGLDFQQFIRTGGQFWACRDAGLMHHKFAVIDHQILLTGSYNWTYNSNAENLLVTNDAMTLRAFGAEFDRLKCAAKRIFQIRSADIKVFSAFALFENTRFPLTELRKRVGSGARVWLIRLDKLCVPSSVIFTEKQIAFDNHKFLTPFWAAYRIWDEILFSEEMDRITAQLSVTASRELRCWAQRMKIGDLIFATERREVLIAIGVIQSHPQPFAGDAFSSYRSVQWLEIMEETAYLLPDKASNQPVTRYQGSALRVLQDVFVS